MDADAEGFFGRCFSGGSGCFSGGSDGGMLVVVVFMWIQSVYLSYDTINTTFIKYWWKFEEKKEQGSSKSNLVQK